MSEASKVHDIAEARAEEARRQRFAQVDAQLAKSDKLVVLGTVSNLILIIGNDPVLTGTLAFNEFTCTAVIHRSPPASLEGAKPIPGPYPRPWGTADVSHVQSYIQRAWTRHAGATETEAAMMAVATVRRFHPVRDWIDSLKWDGTQRLDTWLVKSFGSPDTEYTRAIGPRFLIAAVRRVRQPGVKFDHMLILEGKQSLGKSSAARSLFSDEWFTDSLPSALESRDAALGLQGAWCVEFGEIEQIIRAEVEVIKAFLSRSVDRFRAPYGRLFLTYPRQCVLIGTTNDDGYLRDSTGNRRFWPTPCSFVDLDWVKDNREQLWAEAAAREHAKEDHWLHENDIVNSATVQQSDRMMEDVWEERIIRATAEVEKITVGELLSDTLFILLRDQTKREQMRVAAILRKEGWKRQLAREEGQVARYWIRSG